MAAFGTTPARSKYESRSERIQNIDETEITRFVDGAWKEQWFDRKREASDSQWSDNRGSMGGVGRESHSESLTRYSKREKGDLATSGWVTETRAGSSMSNWKVTQPGTAVARGGSSSPWKSETKSRSWPSPTPSWWADTWVVVYPTAAWQGAVEGFTTMAGWGWSWRASASPCTSTF